jgi:hypothetical protein
MLRHTSILWRANAGKRWEAEAKPGGERKTAPESGISGASLLKSETKQAFGRAPYEVGAGAGARALPKGGCLDPT